MVNLVGLRLVAVVRNSLGLFVVVCSVFKSYSLLELSGFHTRVHTHTHTLANHTEHTTLGAGQTFYLPVFVPVGYQDILLLGFESEFEFYSVTQTINNTCSHFSVSSQIEKAQK